MGYLRSFNSIAMDPERRNLHVIRTRASLISQSDLLHNLYNVADSPRRAAARDPGWGTVRQSHIFELLITFGHS